MDNTWQIAVCYPIDSWHKNACSLNGHICHLSTPLHQMKSLNSCPTGSEFHNLRRGHCRHNKNSFSLSQTTVKVENIIKCHIGLTQGPEPLTKGVINFIISVESFMDFNYHAFRFFLNICWSGEEDISIFGLFFIFDPHPWGPWGGNYR